MIDSLRIPDEKSKLMQCGPRNYTNNFDAMDPRKHWPKSKFDTTLAATLKKYFYRKLGIYIV